MIKKGSMKALDLIGQRFGRLLVKEKATNRQQGHIIWECLCDCGSKAFVTGACLRSGNTKSCGCYNIECTKIRNSTHGLSKHPIYSTWKSIQQRCYNPQQKYYSYYGERGITVCEEWKKSPKVFIDWAEKHGWKKGLTVDRRDNDKEYAPWNCRIVTRSDNSLNMRLLQTANTSGFRGVSWDKSRKRYSSYINYKGKRYSLGRFISAVEAAEKRDAFVIKNGLNTPLNFPKTPQEVVR